MKNIVVNGVMSKYYVADEEGNIYNIEGKKMTYFRTWNGYDRVKLCRDVPNRMYLVHRIIAETFISNPNNQPIINHKNSIRSDNRVVNLEWCDNSYNQKQRFLHNPPTKTAPVRQLDLDSRKELGRWNTLTEAMRATKVQAANISKVCRGERIQAGGYAWEYIK